MRIKVTEDHIRRGIKHPCGCPVALAIKEKMKLQEEDPSIKVFNFEVLKRSGQLWETHALPDEVIQWVRDFDNNKKVSPIGFTLSFSSV